MQISSQQSSTSLDSSYQHELSPAWLVYKATAPSGKVYIGLTSRGLDWRKEQHYRHAASPKSRTKHTHMGRALLKYGKRIQWEVLKDQISSLEAAWKWEQHFIAFYKANDPSYGYNATKGGEGCRPVSKSENHRQSLKRINAHPVLRSDGVAFLSGQDAARALACKNTDAVCKAIRQNRSCKGFFFERISLKKYQELDILGRSWDGISTTRAVKAPRAFSEEHRANLSKARKRYLQTSPSDKARLMAISKKVYCSDGRCFNSIKEAAQMLEVSVHQIRYACQKGKDLRGITVSLTPFLSSTKYSVTKGTSPKREHFSSTISHTIKQGTSDGGSTFTKVNQELLKSS